MKLKITLLFPALLLLAMAGQAQILRVLYEVVPSGDGHVLKVYLQSNLDEQVDVRAVNLSLALPADVKVDMKSALFVDSWTNYLQEARKVSGLELNYEGTAFSDRFQYGNADPGLPNTGAIAVPSRNDDPLLVMEAELQGADAAQVYLEHQIENALNQIGGAGMTPVDYEIVHPQRNAGLEGADLLVEKLEIFPIPAVSNVTFRIAEAQEEVYRFQVSDIQGRAIAAEQVAGETLRGGINFSLEVLPAGAYLVQFTGESGKQFSGKFLKTR